MEDVMLIEILKEMQKKYQCIVEIERITKDMGEALSRNDRTSVQMLIGMRQEEMDKADGFERNVNYLLSSLSEPEAVQVREWIKGNIDRKPDTEAARLIVEKGISIRNMLKKAIEIDRRLSTRLAGQDSFYQ